MQLSQHTVLIIASASELKDSEPVWGTGGWLPPEERTALDWVTLCRLMGLKALVTAAAEFNPEIFISEKVKWVIIACDPNILKDKFIEQLTLILKKYSISLISQLAEINSPFAKWSETAYGNSLKSGKNIVTNFSGIKKTLTCRGFLECREIQRKDQIETLALLEDLPIIITSPNGIGKLILLAFGPSQWRDEEGLVTFLLQRLLLFTSNEPVVCLDWQNTLVLRMDDPGSSETVYNKRYKKNKLRKEEWREIGDELLKRNGRMSIGYVSGWVDDGDDSRGKLFINGEAVERVPGKVYPSSFVKYQAAGSHEKNIFDYKEEFDSIQELRENGLAEVEMHGFTHVFPDRNAWLKAPDKYDNNAWYREFGSDAIQYLKENPQDIHPLDSALQQFQLLFNIKPVTLISPGEVFTNAILIDALNKGLMLVSSYYLATRHNNRFCWSQHVCSPYLDKPEEKWLDAGLPVVGYFHDFDIAEKGVGWFSDCLIRWEDAGVKRLIDFYELNAILNLQSEIKIEDEVISLILRTDPDFPIPKSFQIYVFFPDKNFPAHIKVKINESSTYLNVTKVEEHIGMILIKV
jgi:hypothetical protein